MIQAGSGARPRAGRPRPSGWMLAWVGALTLVVGLGVGLGLHYGLAGPAPAPTIVSSRYGLDGPAAWPAGARPAPPITTLRDQTGQRFTLASLRGQTVAIVFFDSLCHQECPLEGRALSVAERTLPAAQRPVVVAVSVDPLDTPASARAAIHAWGLAGVSSWHWLMGRRAALAPVWRAYHVYVGSRVNGDIAHTEAVYLVDRRGFERSAYLYPFASRFVRHDLRRLAAERRQ